MFHSRIIQNSSQLGQAQTLTKNGQPSWAPKATGHKQRSWGDEVCRYCAYHGSDHNAPLQIAGASRLAAVLAAAAAGLAAAATAVPSHHQY